MALRMERLRLGHGFGFRARSSSLVGWSVDWRIGLERRLHSMLHLLWTDDRRTQFPAQPSLVCDVLGGSALVPLAPHVFVPR